MRHGATEWSVAHRHTGRTDIPLTEAGRADARRVGERLAGREFDLVLTSPLSRAAETCRLAGFEGERCDDLVEWDYGEYDGITTKEIRTRRPDWDLWRDGCPGGESPAAVGARADRVLERLGFQGARSPGNPGPSQGTRSPWLFSAVRPRAPAAGADRAVARAARGRRAPVRAAHRRRLDARPRAGDARDLVVESGVVAAGRPVTSVAG